MTTLFIGFGVIFRGLAWFLPKLLQWLALASAWPCVVAYHFGQEHRKRFSGVLADTHDDRGCFYHSTVFFGAFLYLVTFFCWLRLP